MNMKRFLLTCLVIFIYVFLYEWGFHGVIMEGMYKATAHMWRSEQEMLGYFHYLVIGQFIFAVMFTFIFTQGYQNKGIGEGMRYGFYIALLLSPAMLMWYAVQPIPSTMLVYWLIGGFAELIVAGAIAAIMYKSS